MHANGVLPGRKGECGRERPTEVHRMVELPLPAQRPGEVRSFVVLRKFAVGVRGSRLLHKADLCGETANIMRYYIYIYLKHS